MAATVNPIIPGFAPDPSVTRIGDTFFLVNSTFHLFPGLPIYASKDLVNWTLIGNAINRQSQLSLRLSDTKLHPQEDGTVMLATGGLFAPTIRHGPRSDKTYIINTNVVHPEDGGEDVPENFILETDDIWSDSWSDPVYLDFSGIDPSIFWDEDGTGGIYPEGPHIYKKDGFYYLLISEGGTFKDHMITVARSSNIRGPYKSHEKNPILTAAGTDNYVHCTGHCDMFQDEQDRWWGVTFSHHFKTNIIDSPKSGLDWLYIRNATLQDHEIDDRSIHLTPSKADLSQWQDPVSFVGKRQRKLEGHASVILTISEDDPCRAGLVVYKDEHRYTRIWYDGGKKIVCFEVINNAKKIARSHEAKIEDDIEELHMLIEYAEEQLVLQYMEETGVVKTIGTVDTGELSNADFVGPIIGVFATSDSDCPSPVLFKDFRIDQ
ncbi:hypothetical protein D6D04_08710 [Aureobasidium pullulans]|nr:hypothetical protein D6D04_08710 [Aureobasidium pullulans]